MYEGTAAPTRQAQIPEQLQVLDKSLTMLQENMEMLKNRLEPVRNQHGHPPSGVPDSKAPETCAPVAQSLREFTARVAATSQVVADLITELEV